MRKKYQSWGDFLKTRRERKYRSAREFCVKADLSISYPQYSRYEAGEQLPPVEQVVDLCQKLDVQLIEALMEWNLAQLQDRDGRASLTSILDQVRGGSSVPVATQAAAPSASGPALPRTVSLDDVVVFNRSHLKLFLADPLYRDIFTFVNSFAPEWIPAEDISASLLIPMEKLEPMLEGLNETGILLMAGGRCRAPKSNFYFPDDPDFFPLRNANFEQNVNGILERMKLEDIKEKRAYRGLLTRELTDDQAQKVIAKLEEFLAEVVGLPETDKPEKVYSLCLMVGERYRRVRTQAGAQPGLRTELEVPSTVSATPLIEASQASEG
jgi:hypothetical protein